VKPCKSKWQQKWIKLDVVHPSLQELADAAQKFCARWFGNAPKPSLLVIVGNYGSGKTHVAQSIFRFCRTASFSSLETGAWGANHVPSAIYISWPEACTEFEQKIYGVLQDAIESDLVVLDDIGAENDPWKTCSDKLCQILSRREKQFTVVTTNIAPAEWASRFDGRINDRLMRNSVIVDISEVGSYAMVK